MSATNAHNTQEVIDETGLLMRGWLESYEENDQGGGVTIRVRGDNIVSEAVAPDAIEGLFFFNSVIH